jgi:hypothetical protein
MFKRLAFFEGAIRPCREAAFDAYVNERLVPLWTRFPKALRIEALREVEAEDGAHRYPMVLSTAYPDRGAIDEALGSSVRFESYGIHASLRIVSMTYGATPRTLWKIRTLYWLPGDGIVIQS